MQLRILRWGDYAGLLQSQFGKRVNIRERIPERILADDNRNSALMKAEGTESQGQEASRN